MIPFLSSRAGGFHERLIDLDDRATPEKSLGAAAGPVVTEREEIRACISWTLTIFIKLYCENSSIWSDINSLSCHGTLVSIIWVKVSNGHDGNT